MPENSNPDPIAMFDQMGTTLENSAVMFCAYYKKLIDGGIPFDLACKMVADIQGMFFSKLVNK